MNILTKDFSTKNYKNIDTMTETIKKNTNNLCKYFYIFSIIIKIKRQLGKILSQYL